jgi:hypothetical protein
MQAWIATLLLVAAIALLPSLVVGGAALGIAVYLMWAGKPARRQASATLNAPANVIPFRR